MLKIGFFGDFNACWPKSKDNINRIDSVVNQDLLNFFRLHDFNICNLEAPITNSDERIKKTGLNLKQTTQSLDLLKYLKISHVSLANNHIMDYGPEGLKETITNLKKNKISFAGAGLSHKQIKKPLIIKQGNISAGIICAAEDEFNNSSLYGLGTNKLDIVELYSQIVNLKSKVNKIILFLHGGIEHQKFPTIRQREKYRCLIDIGVDCIIGSHSHCYQGIEKYKNGIIFYSLGNFYFNDRGFKDAKISLAVRLLIGNKINYEIVFLKNDFKNQRIILLNDVKQAKHKKNINELSEKTLIDNHQITMYNNYSKKNLNKTFKIFIPLNKFLVAIIKRTNLFKFFVSEKKFLEFLNTIQNETARNILLHNLISIFKKYYK